MVMQNPDTRPWVLVVEDDPLARRALVHLLKSAGLAPVAAESAEQALELMKKRPMPDAALVDFELPGMNGLQLISLLQKNDRDLLSILMSGVDRDSVRRNIREQIVTFLQKPLQVPALLRILGENAGN